MDTEQEIRKAIREQKCPWCNRGGFRALGIHTNLKHQVSADELREMAGFTKSEPVSDPQWSEECRERELRRIKEGVLPPVYRYPVSAKSATREYSRAGLKVQRRKAKALVAKNRLVDPVTLHGRAVAAGLANAKTARRPRPCANAACHNFLPVSYGRATCSPVCERIIRQQAGHAGLLTRYGVRSPTCGVTGCGGRHTARGLCNRHYLRLLKGNLVMRA